MTNNKETVEFIGLGHPKPQQWDEMPDEAKTQYNMAVQQKTDHLKEQEIKAALVKTMEVKRDEVIDLLRGMEIPVAMEVLTMVGAKVSEPAIKLYDDYVNNTKVGG